VGGGKAESTHILDPDECQVEKKERKGTGKKPSNTRPHKKQYGETSEVTMKDNDHTKLNFNERENLQKLEEPALKREG